MKIAVLSGKGGTGKTFVSVNLAASVENSLYVDCDVEEPNGLLFLPCPDTEERAVSVMLPHFDADRCVGCRACTDFCQFNALAFIAGKPKVFAEVCHSCGGCSLVCPSGAVSEIPKPIGKLKLGESGQVGVISGELNIGEASGVPIIRSALREATARNAPLTVIDCPPGSACTVTECISCADYCITVAEPTLFGLHDLGMVTELIQKLNKPCGVVINKWDGDFPPLEAFCSEKGLPILARIPFSRQLASLISEGHLASKDSTEAREIFSRLAQGLGGEL